MTVEVTQYKKGDPFPLFGRLLIQTDIRLLTGLHIGGTPAGIEIGGMNNPIIRNPINNQPYIPGSSLRGKLRSLLEKSQKMPFNQRIQDIYIHGYGEELGLTNICCIFGVNSDIKVAEPTRLFIRDVTSLEIEGSNSETKYDETRSVEVKWEASIDRVTSAAVPRQQERISAGVIFRRAEMVFNFYPYINDKHSDDYTLFELVLEGLRLLEDDYLGGSGSRGSGKIAFENIKLFAKRVDVKNAETYSRSLKELPTQKYENLEELFTKRQALLDWLRQEIPLS